MDTTHQDDLSGLTSVNSRVSTSRYLQQMWERRHLAVEVPMERLRTAHKLTLLGNAWHLVNPLLQIGVYYLVFGVVFGVSRGVEYFPLWLTIGIFAFRATRASAVIGADAITSNSGLIKSVRFPRALLPVSVVSSELITFAIELAVTAVLVIMFGPGPTGRWLLLPLVVVVHTALNLGLAFIAARLNDAFKDVKQLIPFLFMLLRYFSGVMFPLTRLLDVLPEASPLTTIVSLNPIARILDLYRWIFLESTLDVGALAITTAICFSVFWFGFRFFRSVEWRYGRV